MNFKKLFLRGVKSKIICDTPELKKMITDWCKSEGWKFKDFEHILNSVGVETPVTLSEYDKETNSFKCSTALNTEVRISLYFSDSMDFHSEIHVTEGEEKRKYILYNERDDPHKIPCVTEREKFFSCS